MIIAPRMRQAAIMTGQMQQAISLLQFTNTELLSHIDKEAEENPFIEFSSPSITAPRTGSGLGDSQSAIAGLPERPTSLYAHVSAQLSPLFTDPRDRQIAERFLDALDQHGWLDEPLEEIATACGMDLDEAESFLTSLQQVEPAGLFARNLAECLRLQVEAQDRMTPVIAKILENLDTLASANVPAMLRACACTMPELSAGLKVIRALDPKPGAGFDSAPHKEREPDLFVRRTATGWVVELNRSTMPAVRVDLASAKQYRRDETAWKYAGDRLRMAKWLHRAVEHRNRTTLDVAAEIVRRQAAFLKHGERSLAPLTLAEVAEAVGVHESTVSRVTTGNLIATPHGALPLKRFFSTALTAPDRAETDGMSAAAVRFQIQQLIANEDPTSPLSDDALVREIGKTGPQLARRTVAKYRGQLKIPSSFARRRSAAIARV
ncbi:MAG: RNA polymerase factor sigma-54 [Pseudomonadota bacterium]